MRIKLFMLIAGLAGVAAMLPVAGGKAQYFKDQVEFSSSIQSGTDYFGFIRFAGTVINTGKKRADYVRVDIALFDEDDKLIETVSTFVWGDSLIFQDGTVSNSSVAPGEEASFECFTHARAIDIKRFTPEITFKEFDELPEFYFRKSNVSTSP